MNTEQRANSAEKRANNAEQKDKSQSWKDTGKTVAKDIVKGSPGIAAGVLLDKAFNKIWSYFFPETPSSSNHYQSNKNFDSIDKKSSDSEQDER